jgi:hypothetical protein
VKRKRPGKRERKEATVTQPANPASKKKPHHLTVMKEKARAMDALLEQYGSIEALQGAMQEKHTMIASELVVETAAASPPETVVPLDIAKKTDPLAWITLDTPYVALVSGIAVFGLWTGDDPKGRDSIDLVNTGIGPWLAMPFEITHANRAQEQNERVMKATWWQHRLQRSLVERIYKPGKKSVPTKAVLTPEDYEGWDKVGMQARGTYSPLTEFVPLREEVRRLLQRHADTFLDWTSHKQDFDPRLPNPYNNRLAALSAKIRPEVRDWQARPGDWEAPV